MIINDQIITPDIWEEIADLEITEGMNYLYKRGFFSNIPTHDENGEPYNSVFETGVEFKFDFIDLFDYGEKIRQLELLIKLKHKYDKPYDKQMSKLEDIYEQLKVLNVLHK